MKLLLALAASLLLSTLALMASPITFPSPDVYLSPYCWRIDDHAAAICPAGGGYLKFAVTGTRAITLHVDTSVNAGFSQIQMPAIKVVVNAPNRDGMAQYIQLPSNTNPDVPLVIATGLNPDFTYTVLIQALGGDETNPNGWTTTIFQTKINSIDLDAGGKLLPPALRPKRALFLGASYEQAYFGYAKPDAPVYTYVDPSLSWPFFAAYGLGCEYGQLGIGSQGWVRYGNGGYPAFPFTWDRFDPAHAKAYAHDLDYVFIHMAENDNAQDDGAIEKAVAAWIPKARAAFGPRAKIFVILSITQIKSAPIKAGVAAAADPNTFIIDPGTEFQRVAFAGGPTWAAPGDGIHLDAVHQGIYTAFVLQQAQSIIDCPRHAN